MGLVKEAIKTAELTTILCLYIDIFLQKCVRQIHSANSIEHIHKRFCITLIKLSSLQKLLHYYNPCRTTVEGTTQIRLQATSTVETASALLINLVFVQKAHALNIRLI